MLALSIALTNTHLCSHTLAHSPTHMHTHTHNAHTHTHTHTHTQYTHTHTHTHTLTGSLCGGNDASGPWWWGFFQNCHLSPSWMPALERLIEQVEPDKVGCYYHY